MDNTMTNTQRQLQHARRQARYTVAGQNEQGRWDVRHPSGLLCGGSWASKQDAQQDVDTWNARITRRAG